ncbi:MAG: carbamoyltransferase, partial [Armatimonadota bacterium]|nr:carbamoyltransferase [Armatimonadota bacterium]
DSGTPVLGPVRTSAFVDAFGPARRLGDPLEERHQDIAASLQAMLEEAMLHLLEDLHRRVGGSQLCLAGGVALNCTANGKIRAHTPFKEIYIQPAAGDDGTAIGAAYYVHHQENGAARSFVMANAYTGSEFSDEAIADALVRRGIQFQRCSDLEETARETAALIAGGMVVGWFQGAMEFGPRALGNRSIVVDPRQPQMKDVLNHRIKHRETFRPFAPSVLLEEVGNYFEQDYPSPFMLMTYRVRDDRRQMVPAVTHVDGTGRVQTVDRATAPNFWTLIKAFEAQTGIPMLVNTSFNENEPIVCTPDEALDCFYKTHMDAVALGNFIVRKVTG